MQQAVKDKLKKLGLPQFTPNRKQGKRRQSQPLCTCGLEKRNKKHNNTLPDAHGYKASRNKNTLSVQEPKKA